MVKRILLTASVFAVTAGGLWMMRAQEQEPAPPGVAHAECTFFGPQREHFLPRDRSGHLSEITGQVTSMLGTSSETSHATMAAASMPSAPGGSRTFGKGSTTTTSTNLIDGFIWQGVSGARRDARGADQRLRIHPPRHAGFDRPHSDAATRCRASSPIRTPNKRANLDRNAARVAAVGRPVDHVLTAICSRTLRTSPSTGTIVTTAAGRDAFNTYIRNSLTNGTPYNQMASDADRLPGNQ